MVHATWGDGSILTKIYINIIYINYIIVVFYLNEIPVVSFDIIILLRLSGFCMHDV